MPCNAVLRDNDNHTKLDSMATTIDVPLTLEEFAQLSDAMRHEISEGELITMAPPKFLHTLVAVAVFELLQAYLKQHGGARAFPEAGYVLSHDPLTIRQPDVSVLTAERIRATNVDAYVEGSPELAVEVVSPSHSAQDLEIKVQQYLHSGAKQVWVVYPITKRVHVLGSQVTVLGETQTLEAGDLLPGFSVKVADLFVSENHVSS
jgi:Uma2 family endonuclease